MAAITIDTKVKTEREAVAGAIDIIKNPPSNPIAMLGWVGKNFSIAGDLTKAISTTLPAVGKLLPIAGAIFEAFSSFSGPSIGQQIAEMAQAIGEQISAGVQELKNALSLSTEKTISAIISEVQGASLDESAARVIQALNESEIMAEADAVKAQIIADYTAEVKRLNQAWQEDILTAIESAQAEVDQLYKQIQDLLSQLGIDLLKDLYSRLMALNADLSPDATQRALTSEGAPPPLPAEIQSNAAPLIVAGGLVALLLVLKNKKN